MKINLVLVVSLILVLNGCANYSSLTSKGQKSEIKSIVGHLKGKLEDIDGKAIRESEIGSLAIVSPSIDDASTKYRTYILNGLSGADALNSGLDNNLLLTRNGKKAPLTENDVCIFIYRSDISLGPKQYHCLELVQRVNTVRVLKVTINELDDDISNLAEKIIVLENKLTSLGQNLNNKLTLLNQNLNTVSEFTRSLEAKTIFMSGDIDKIEDSLTIVRDEYKDISNHLVQSREEVLRFKNEIQGNMDSLQSQMDELNSELAW